MQRWSGRAARVFFVETAMHVTLLGEITRLEGTRLSIRCIPPRELEIGARCTLAMEEDGQIFRARGHLEARSDVHVTVRLNALPSRVERRMYGRATLFARLRARREGEAEFGPWRLEAVELSPSGLKFAERGTLSARGELNLDERVTLGLHIPGPAKGIWFELPARVTRLSSDSEAPFIVFQFIDLRGAVLLEIVDVIDQRLLGIGQERIELA
ncbi:PilZ domain-containing protein [Myxococcota bacterium]|nr:PilZ domain-containing protein [Myxococcota bacterium]MBU1430893.1 PilZ domain-containing protein [Myxococcota bacterium]MBU1899200.1 PilZ domain-containing protein [Myxococcota bacterium]